MPAPEPKCAARVQHFKATTLGGSSNVKPRLILLIAVLLECVLLLGLRTPSTNQDPQSSSESTQWREDPTPEQERMLQRMEVWQRWRPQLLCILGIANGGFILGYGARVWRRERAKRASAEQPKPDY